MECQERKSEEKWKEFISEGDEYGAQSLFYEALVSYNKSLCFAPVKSSQLSSLAYFKRSKIYFELEKYEKCLENIEYARQCQIEFKDEIDELEKKCKALMTEEKYSNDVWNFFKLSYPSHAKLPNIVSSLKPVDTFKYGKCVITTEPLRTGDVIAFEEPLFKIVNKTNRYSRCSGCMKSNLMSLIPCQGRCTSSMFCSSSCLTSSWNKFHKYECRSLDESLDNDNEYDLLMLRIIFESLMYCGGLEKLQALLNDKKLNVNVFDFEFSESKNNFENERNLIKAVYSFKKGPTSAEDLSMADWIVDVPALTALYKSKAQRDFLKAFVVKMMGVVDRNSYIFFSPSQKTAYVHEEVGSGVFPFASLINHSCSPNLYRVFVDNKQVFVVKKPIKAGQQLFVGYQANFTVSTREERQNYLLKEFQFKCSCEACSANYPLMKNLEKCDESYKEPPYSVETTKDAKETIKKNCDYIDENIKNLPFPSYDICSAMQNTFRHLQFVAGKSFLIGK